jgi:hypothetical protein
LGLVAALTAAAPATLVPTRAGGTPKILHFRYKSICSAAGHDRAVIF